MFCELFLLLFAVLKHFFDLSLVYLLKMLLVKLPLLKNLCGCRPRCWVRNRGNWGGDWLVFRVASKAKVPASVGSQGTAAHTNPPFISINEGTVFLAMIACPAKLVNPLPGVGNFHHMIVTAQRRLVFLEKRHCTGCEDGGEQILYDKDRVCFSGF